jgi:hypothetical protein
MRSRFDSFYAIAQKTNNIIIYIYIYMYLLLKQNIKINPDL